MRIRWVASVATLAAVAAVTGCSKSDEAAWDTATDPAAAAYVGLPQDVVEERLSDPAFLEILETGFAADEWQQTVQENVAYAVFCRDEYNAYDAWISTGERPEALEVVTPDAPLGSFVDDMKLVTGGAQAAIDSGDPTELKADLLAVAGCGDYPVEPGSKETIADALAAG